MVEGKRNYKTLTTVGEVVTREMKVDSDTGAVISVKRIPRRFKRIIRQDWGGQD